MWLPTPVYARAPYYWMLMGALLVIVGVYLGFEGNRGFMYFGLVTGFASCAWGGRVYTRRGQDLTTAKAASSAATTD